jgi:hypothetical protein
MVTGCAADLPPDGYARRPGLAMAAPAPQVRRVLETAGFTKILPFYDAEADAVHAARHRPPERRDWLARTVRFLRAVGS